MNRMKWTPVPESASLNTLIRMTQHDIDTRDRKIRAQMPKKPVPIKRRKK